MGEPDRCDVSAMAAESIARPMDQASARFPDLLHGGIGVVGLLTEADAIGPARPAMAKSEICFEGSDRRLALDGWRRDDQFMPIAHDGEAKPIRGYGARTPNPSGSRLGAAVVTQGTCYPGLDNAAVSRDQLQPDGIADSKKRSRQPASASIPIPRRAPKKSGQRQAVSRRPLNRGGHSAREPFNNVPRERSRGLRGFLYAGAHLNLSYLWQDNRILGLDPYDWFILLGGAAFSGAMVLLS
jgi:hypothetical protein